MHIRNATVVALSALEMLWKTWLIELKEIVLNPLFKGANNSTTHLNHKKSSILKQK
jgi:hypothetical protein